eukprot:scaffold324_cov394-Prasinococcus_capsulatus_cf.AAC.27
MRRNQTLGCVHTFYADVDSSCCVILRWRNRWGRAREEVVVEIYEELLYWTRKGPVSPDKCRGGGQANCISVKTTGGRVYLVAPSSESAHCWRGVFRCLFSYADALLWGIV